MFADRELLMDKTVPRTSKALNKFKKLKLEGQKDIAQFKEYEKQSAKIDKE